MTPPSFLFHDKATRFATWLAWALLAFGPVFFLIIDEAGGVVWAGSILAGLAVAWASRNQWWPELHKNRQVLLCLGLLLIYLAIPAMSFFLVDRSDFAVSRIKRQFLFLGIPFVFLMLWWLRPRLQDLLLIIALNASVFGIYAIAYMWLHADRVPGATHAIHFGNGGLYLAFASLALLPVARSYRERILAPVGMILGCSASVLSGARGGWIAVPILVIISLIMAVRKLRWRRSILLAVAGIMFLTPIGLWQMHFVQERVFKVQKDWERLGEYDPLNAVELRFLMWEQAWLEICEAPTLGTGFSGYRNRMLAALKSDELPAYMTYYATEPHNEYFYQWATRGMIGLAIFLLYLGGVGFYFSKWLLRGDRVQVSIAQVGLSLVTIIAIGGLTITVIDQRDVIRFIGWNLAVLMYCVWQYSQERPAREPREV